jgi:putative RecB family exonuclease
MSRKPTLSPTRISTYLECAVKYRYIYLDKIGRFYQRARPFYSFGSTMHQVLHVFHREGGEQSAEQVVENYAQSWVSAGYESAQQEQEYRDAGREMIVSYLDAAKERALLNIETLYLEKTFNADMGEFVLSGRLDRVDRHPDGSLEVIDYKSGHWEPTPEEVASDLAMNIYQLLLRRNFPQTRVFATIYNLRSGAQASTELSDEEAESFTRDLLQLGAQILHRDYQQIEPVRIAACDDCDFLSRCRRFWRQQEALDRF